MARIRLDASASLLSRRNVEPLTLGRALPAASLPAQLALSLQPLQMGLRLASADVSFLYPLFARALNKCVKGQVPSTLVSSPN